MTPAQKTTHLKAVLKALPADYRSDAHIRYSELTVYGATVRFTDGWLEPKLKVEFNYSIKEAVPTARSRTWKCRERDGRFAYDRAAAYIVRIAEEYDKVIESRNAGEATARLIGKRLVDTFANDRMLSALELEVTSAPVPNTTTGEAVVRFRGADMCGINLRSADGKTFYGKVDVGSVTVEQVVAIMTVLRVKKLNLLDMLNLADDSILGPIIRKLTDDDER